MPDRTKACISEFHVDLLDSGQTVGTTIYTPTITASALLGKPATFSLRRSPPAAGRMYSAVGRVGKRSTSSRTKESVDQGLPMWRW